MNASLAAMLSEAGVGQFFIMAKYTLCSRLAEYQNLNEPRKIYVMVNVVC